MILKKTIVILYETGEHANIALDLREQLQKTYPDHYVVLINDSQYLHGDGAKLTRGIMRLLADKAPKLEYLLSRAQDNAATRKVNRARKKLRYESTANEANEITKMLNGRLKHMRNIYYRFNPELMMCLSPKNLNMAISAKILLGLNNNIAAYIPNVVLDKRYISFDCDAYYVVNKDVRAKLIKYGVGENRIIVSGFPVHHLDANSKSETRTRLGIQSDLPVVLLTCGALGQIKMQETFQTLLEDSERFNLVVDIGNEKPQKYEKLVELCPARENIKICSGEAVRDLIPAADILVTTPDIDRAYLAFNAKIPVFFIKPSTVLQTKSASYLHKKGLALQIDSSDRLYEQIGNVLQHNEDSTRRLLTAYSFVTNKSDDEKEAADD